MPLEWISGASSFGLSVSMTLLLYHSATGCMRGVQILIRLTSQINYYIEKTYSNYALCVPILKVIHPLTNPII